MKTLCFALGVEEGDVVIDGAVPMAPWVVARLGGLVMGLFDLTEPGRRGAGSVVVRGGGLAAGDAEGRGLPPASSQLSPGTPSPEDAHALLPR